MLSFDVNTSENKDLYDYFYFNVLENDECVSEFRFNKQDLHSYIMASLAICMDEFVIVLAMCNDYPYIS